jgi:hypothetical protein
LNLFYLFKIKMQKSKIGRNASKSKISLPGLP